MNDGDGDGFSLLLHFSAKLGEGDISNELVSCTYMLTSTTELGKITPISLLTFAATLHCTACTVHLYASISALTFFC